MKIIINDIKWDHKAFSDIDTLRVIIATKLTKLNIKANLNKVGNSLVFLPTKTEGEYKRLFIAAAENKIPMRDDDPRIKKLGRNYLVSKRLTKEQTDMIETEAINGTLDDLGLNATVQYFAKDDSSFLLIRENKTIKNTLPRPTSYPVKGEA